MNNLGSILRGPAGGGKSQYFEENSEAGDLFLDITTLWAALLNLERDPVTGLYPLRLGRVSSFAGCGVSEDGGDSVRFEGKSQRMGDYFQFFSGCR